MAGILLQYGCLKMGHVPMFFFGITFWQGPIFRPMDLGLSWASRLALRRQLRLHHQRCLGDVRSEDEKCGWPQIEMGELHGIAGLLALFRLWDPHVCSWSGHYKCHPLSQRCRLRKIEGPVWWPLTIIYQEKVVKNEKKKMGGLDKDTQSQLSPSVWSISWISTDSFSKNLGKTMGDLTIQAPHHGSGHRCREPLCRPAVSWLRWKGVLIGTSSFKKWWLIIPNKKLPKKEHIVHHSRNMFKAPRKNPVPQEMLFRGSRWKAHRRLRWRRWQRTKELKKVDGFWYSWTIRIIFSMIRIISRTILLIITLFIAIMSNGLYQAIPGKIPSSQPLAPSRVAPRPPTPGEIALV